MLFVLLQCSLSFVVVCCASVIYNQRYQPYKDANLQQYQGYYHQELPHRSENYGSIIPSNDFLYSDDEITNVGHALHGPFDEAEDKHAEYNRYRLKHQKKKLKKRFKKRRRCRPAHGFHRFRKPNRNDIVVYDNEDNIKLIPITETIGEYRNPKPQFNRIRIFPSTGYALDNNAEFFINPLRREWNLDQHHSGRGNFVNKPRKPPDYFITLTEKPRTESHAQLKRAKRKNTHKSSPQVFGHKPGLHVTGHESRGTSSPGVGQEYKLNTDLASRQGQNLKNNPSVSDIRKKMPLRRHQVEFPSRKYNVSDNVVTSNPQPIRFSIIDPPQEELITDFTSPESANEINGKTHIETGNNQYLLLKASRGFINLNKNPQTSEGEVIVGKRPRIYSHTIIPNKLFSKNEDEFHPIVGHRMQKDASVLRSNNSSKSSKRHMYAPKENFVVVTPIATLDVSPSRRNKSYQAPGTARAEKQQDTRKFSKDDDEIFRRSPSRRLKSLLFAKYDNSTDMNTVSDLSAENSNISSEGWIPLLYGTDQYQNPSDEDDLNEELNEIHSDEEATTLSNSEEEEPRKLDRVVNLGETDVNEYNPIQFGPEDAKGIQNLVIPEQFVKSADDSDFNFNILPHVRKKIWINKRSDDMTAVVSSHIVVQ